MLYIAAIFLVFLTFSLGSLAQKKYNSRMGKGCGLINNQKWGIEEEAREYHE